MANDNKLVNLADLKAAFDDAKKSASQSSAGLMSADDKKKLDGIASGATANTGTVTSIATGIGLTGGTITGSGTLKAKLRSETALTIDSAAATTTSGRVYPVAVDKTGYLAVNVPWTDNNTTYSAGSGLSLSGTTFSNSGVTSVNNQTGAVSITPANIGAMTDSIAGLSGNQTLASIKSGISQSGAGHVYYNDSTKGFFEWGYLSAVCDSNIKTVLCIAANKIGLLHTDDGSNWTETIASLPGQTITGSATPGTNVTLSTNQIQKSGNVCSLNLWANLSGAVAGNNYVLCTLPEGFRPSTEVNVLAQGVYSMIPDYEEACFVKIRTNGQVATAFGSGTFSGHIIVTGTYFI